MGRILCGREKVNHGENHVLMPKVAAGVIVFGIFFALVSHDLEPQKNTASLEVGTADFQSTLSIAVVADLHLTEGESEHQSLRALAASILAEKPDVIAVLGDFIANPRSLKSLISHRSEVIHLLQEFPKDRTAFVLGNYESWDNRSAWQQGLKNAGLLVLENETRIVTTVKGPVCIRGLGDFYTNEYLYTSFPSECNSLPKVTITHDPAAAFQPGIDGLILAGHTHCGQVSLPLIGPLWAPTEAPRDAWCGLYKDELRTLWVSSGVGTSVLPIRLGAPSQWDLLDVTFSNPRTADEVLR